MTTLPAQIPIFPLPQAILLPRGRLPLNIFEPSYLKMIEDALRGPRVVGMIQPREARSKSDLHDVGCVGRLTSWSETGDGRFLITLSGACRFRIAEELPVATPYRQVRADYTAFRDDETPFAGELDIDRAALFAALEPYLKGKKLEADWTAISEAPPEALINALSMICPFEAPEKQALLEAKTLAERATILIALIEMSAIGDQGTRLQ